MGLGRRLVGGLHHLDGPAPVDLGEDGVGVDVLRLERLSDVGHLAQVLGVVVAQGEEGLVDVEEAIGELVAHHHAGLQGEEPGVVLPATPDVGVALGHVHLTEGEGDERDVPGCPGPEALHHVLVGVAGEGAAIVPGDGEGDGCRTCSGSNPR